jgi:hypothetical protein
MTGTDLSKAVMEDGEWFLVPAKHITSSAYGSIIDNRESVIVHRCHKWTAELRSRDDMPYNPLGYWSTTGCLEFPCKLCNVRPPEAIANLFLLHNFDTFASDPSPWAEVGRSIGSSITRSIHRQELALFIQATHPDRTAGCACALCHDTFGAWQ